VVSRPVNWGHLQQGVVVWLDAPEAMLLERLRADPTPRPLMEAPDPAERMRVLLAKRRPLYAQADLRVEQGDEPPDVVAQRLLERLPGILRESPTPPEQAAGLMDRTGASLN
jgi:shikimate kinase